MRDIPVIYLLKNIVVVGMEVLGTSVEDSLANIPPRDQQQDEGVSQCSPGAECSKPPHQMTMPTLQSTRPSHAEYLVLPVDLPYVRAKPSVSAHIDQPTQHAQLAFKCVPVASKWTPKTFGLMIR